MRNVFSLRSHESTIHRIRGLYLRLSLEIILIMSNPCKVSLMFRFCDDLEALSENVHQLTDTLPPHGSNVHLLWFGGTDWPDIE